MWKLDNYSGNFSSQYLLLGLTETVNYTELSTYDIYINTIYKSIFDPEYFSHLYYDVAAKSFFWFVAY